jgi:hypothetical protein
MKLHEVDLTGKYGHGGQTLDVVEKTALLASLPTQFENDGRGIKKKYMQELEESVKRMIQQAEEHRLSQNLSRNSAYKDQIGRFGDVTDMYCPDVTSSEDAFSPRMSFRSSARSSLTVSEMSESFSSSFDEEAATVNPLHARSDGVSLSRGGTTSSMTACNSRGSAGDSSAIGDMEMSKRKLAIGRFFSPPQEQDPPRGSRDSTSTSTSRSEHPPGIGKSEMQKRTAALSGLFK